MSPLATPVAARGPAKKLAVVGLWLCLCLLPAPACARELPGSLPVDAASHGTANTAGDERRILVTLALAPTRPLPGAGSTVGRYVGSDGYGERPRTRRAVKALAREMNLERVDEWPIRTLGVHCVVFTVPRPRSVDEVLDRLRADPRVESAQRLQQFETLGAEYDDPYAEMQHGLQAMRIPESHRWADGRGVTVAVIDTGVDRRHADLSRRVELARDFVEGAGRTGVPAEHHGTAVAGIIASIANNGVGTVGVAPRADVLALRACWEGRGGGGHCNSFTLAKALAFAVERRPHVLNLSLAGPSDPLLERLLRAAIDAGIVVVAAYHEAGEPDFPGSIPGVLVVRSAVVEGVPGGAAGVLTAPGNEILATTPGGGFDFVSGSSFAAAHVAGVVALLLQHAPEAGHDRLSTLLRDSAHTVTSATGGQVTVVDACVALSGVATIVQCEPDSPHGTRAASR